MAQDEQQKKESNRNKTKDKESKSKEKPPTKVIVRRLPPTMTEEVFLEQIDPLPDNDYFYYAKGEVLVGVPTFSRAYINFKNQEDIFTFQEKFDGYVFVDQRGNEFPAVVEFAPYQKIPRLDSKEDKCNTIDSDPHYLEFLKKLESPEEITLPSAESYLEQIEQKERELKMNGGLRVNTPLVDFIINRRIEKERYREEKKEERKRKELDKKKQRELEQMKKKEAKKESKAPNSKNEEKSSIKVLKNAERGENTSSVEKTGPKENKKTTDRSETQSRRMREEKNLRTKDPKTKERPPREKRENPRTKTNAEKKMAADSSSSVEKQIEVTEKKPETVDKTSDSATKKSEPAESKNDTEPQSPQPMQKSAEESKTEEKSAESDRKRDDREGEAEKERRERIRNKDRPAMQIYRPGAKRSMTNKQAEAISDSSTSGVKRDVKSRTFTRSAPKE